MRTQPLCLLVVLLSGCAASTKQGSLTRANLRSEDFCVWKNVRWHDNGVLMAPESGLPMARARTVWGSKRAWHGATVTGTLKKAGPLFVFQGTWRGEGIVLDADVDASAQAVFSTYVTARAGPAVLLPRGADVVVVRGSPGTVVVMPRPEAMAEFMPVGPPEAEMACESLTLYPQRGDALEWSGFSKDAPTMQLVRSTPVQLRAEPGGTVVGTFAANGEALTVRRIEVQREWTRIASVHFTGPVWHGWVPSAAVREAGNDQVFADLGFGGLGLSGKQDPGGWVACAVEQKLYAALGNTVQHVGRVTAATPFKPRASQGRYVAVSFRSNWLDPEDGVTFLLDAQAATCAPWIAPAPATNDSAR